MIEKMINQCTITMCHQFSQHRPIIWSDKLSDFEFNSHCSHLYFQCHMNLFNTHFKGTELCFNICIHAFAFPPK